MYKINLTMRKLDSDIQLTKSLPEFFYTPSEANLRIKELAEKERLRKDINIKLIQHHAGLSVVFYDNDNYKEYWRSYQNPNSMEQ